MPLARDNAERRGKQRFQHHPFRRMHRVDRSDRQVNLSAADARQQRRKLPLFHRHLYLRQRLLKSFGHLRKHRQGNQRRKADRQPTVGDMVYLFHLVRRAPQLLQHPLRAL